ncbi:glycosyltransferase [Raoultella planticola]|nr:glycosyltransferase [Raoultella planticola]
MKKILGDMVFLSTADWDNPFWTNKQHVALELSKMGYRILYIESLGLRKPSVNKKDIKRIFSRVIKGLKPPRKVRDNIWVWSPITIPLNKYKSVRVLNRILLKTLLAFWCKYLSFTRPILWTYNPLTTNFLDINKFNYTVYHCVDEIKAQPGMPVSIIETAEKELTANADYVFVTSKKLLESRSRWSNNVHYFSNVADYNHFNKALDSNIEPPIDIANLTKPLIGFIGAISSYKINFDLLISVAKSHPEWNIVMIGDIGEGDPSTNASLLRKYENIKILGPKSYHSLPSYLHFFDLTILPNNVNEYTESMFPMKFFEYLAAGKDIVSVNLNALQEFKEYFHFCDTSSHDEFMNKIEGVLNGNGIPLEKKLSLAQQFTYKKRTEKMMNLINDTLGRRNVDS